MPNLTYLAAEPLEQDMVVTPNEAGDLRVATTEDPGPFWRTLRPVPTGGLVALTTWESVAPIFPEPSE